MSTAPAKSASGASQLQRKIFTRWVNQKLGSRKMKVEDCVTGLGTGLELVAMLEVLSEKTCPKQLKKLDAKSPPIQKVDNLQHALKFMYDCGVVLELKPSAENFVDGEEKSILGAVWGIMKTFLKFGDDDENKMNAVDALKMWAANQTHGYKGVNIQDFTKSWHDGLAFCALIHKHRPKLIGDFDKLNPKEDEKNIKIAMTAAEKFFQLDQFLQPGDIKKLDDKSMVIYVSEFYYGIAAQRKVDLAARRIGKLIQFTQINDKMRADYQSRAESMKKGLDKVMVHLRDRTIDNTMAGAKKRLDQFVEYREKDKAGIVGDFLSIESLYNQLSLRLSDRKRPMYNPPQGLDLGGLRSALAELEKCEQERKVALHAELNRQIKLANLNEQHTTRSGAITSWGKEKAVFVGKTETIESVGAAEYHLNALKAFNNESAALQAGSFVEIKKLGKYLLDEKFEHGKDVQSREAAVDGLFKQLNEQSAAKQQVLDDALAREKYKVQVRGWAQVHSDKHKKLAGWQQEKKEYLETEEKINAIDEAELALSLLRAYEAESASLLPAAVPAFKAVGKKVVEAKYETKFSQWKFEHPEEVTSREENVDDMTKTLAQLSQKKLKKLEDDLAREKYKALVRTWNGNHINTRKQIADWVEESTEYLKKAETITNISTAQAALSALDVWESDKTDVTNINVKSLRGYGNQILTAEYKGLTQWKWEKPEEVQQREAWVDEQWQVLAGLSAQKKSVLEKALALEIKKEQLRLAFANQAGDYVLWAKEAADNAGQTHFGFTLEEVESYDAKGNDKKAQDASASKTQAWKATWDEMTGLDVKENVYTQLTPSHLEQAANDLTSALEERAGRYAAELKRQRDNDALCRQFAGLAEPLVKQIDADRDTIAKSSADLEKQLAFVEERLKLAASNEKLDAIKEVQEKMDKAGIKNNPHSAQTARDCEVQWKQYQAFLNTKKTSLAEQIEQKKLRGVTPDQMAEIQQQFTQFDKDKSGAIDGKELRACLYSLGYERGSKEVKAIMDEFGKDDAKHAGGKVMIYDGFKEFMIRQLGDSETKEEMLAGFELVSRGTPAGNNEHSDTVLAESDVAYLKVNAPKAASNPDYKAWILAALAR